MSILVRPRAALVDHCAGVGMAATRVARSTVSRMGRPSDVMPMVGDRLNFAVGEGIERLARLPLISGALNHVVQVRNDAGRAERLPIFVESNAPGIARTFGKYLELVLRRVISPKARVD